MIEFDWRMLRAEGALSQLVFGRFGPLTRGAPVMGISLGSGGATVTGPHVSSQTGSIFAATRSVGHDAETGLSTPPS